MNWIDEGAYFLGGAMLANAFPHLVCGMTGQPFQSPFATPSGIGLSSSTVNVVWGLVNLAAAYGLLFWVGSFAPRSFDMVAVAVGVLLVGLFSARHFGALHGGNI